VVASLPLRRSAAPPPEADPPLPRRSPHASLAPDLAAVHPGHQAAPRAARSPEQVRAMLTRYRSGLERGGGAAARGLPDDPLPWRVRQPAGAGGRGRRTARRRPRRLWPRPWPRGPGRPGRRPGSGCRRSGGGAGGRGGGGRTPAAAGGVPGSPRELPAGIDALAPKRSDPVKRASTAAAAALKVEWPDTYSGNGG